MPVSSFEPLTIYEYLDQKLNYNGTENYLILIFDIEKDGSVLNVKIEKNNDEIFCEKLKEVIRNTSSWKPGMQRGQSVKVRLTYEILLPVFKKPTYELGIGLGDKSFSNLDFSSAITYYNRAYIFDKSDEVKQKLADTYFELGKEYLNQNDTINACFYFRKSISKTSKHTKAKKLLKKYCN